jgi:hypothetical protein
VYITELHYGIAIKCIRKILKCQVNMLDLKLTDTHISTIKEYGPEQT